MAKNMVDFSCYDTTKAAREEQQEKLVESKLELLINQHPAIKSIKEEAQKVRHKAGKVKGIIIFGSYIQPIGLQERINFEENKRIEEFKETIRPELAPKAQRDARTQIIKYNIEDLTVGGVRLSQGHQGCLSVEDKQELYSRLVVELNALSENGKNEYVRRQIPEIQEVTKYTLLFTEENISVLKRTLKRLAQQRYIYPKNGDTLLNLLTSTEKRLPQSTTSGPVVPSRPISAEEVAVNKTLGNTEFSTDNISEFKQELTRLVGEGYAVNLLQRIPIDSYEKESMLSTYLRTVRRIQEEIRKNPRQLAEKYGPTPDNIDTYTSLDGLLRLKEELFNKTRGEHNTSLTTNASFNLEGYKDKLLAKAGLEVEVARAYTEGKNGRIVGENNYMPRRHFKSNAKRKAPPDKFHQQGDAVFDELVKMGAIVCKSRGRDLYSLNPHLDTIENSFLREYMRVTVHYEKILKQEGKIRPLIEI